MRNGSGFEGQSRAPETERIDVTARPVVPPTVEPTMLDRVRSVSVKHSRALAATGILALVAVPGVPLAINHFNGDQNPVTPGDGEPATLALTYDFDKVFEDMRKALTIKPKSENDAAHVTPKRRKYAEDVPKQVEVRASSASSPEVEAKPNRPLQVSENTSDTKKSGSSRKVRLSREPKSTGGTKAAPEETPTLPIPTNSTEPPLSFEEAYCKAYYCVPPEQRSDPNSASCARESTEEQRKFYSMIGRC